VTLVRDEDKDETTAVMIKWHYCNVLRRVRWQHLRVIFGNWSGTRRICYCH